jgi:hypothetical protein
MMFHLPDKSWLLRNNIDSAVSGFQKVHGDFSLRFITRRTALSTQPLPVGKLKVYLPPRWLTFSRLSASLLKVMRCFQYN